MSEKKVSAFKGTKQQEEKLLQVIQNHEGAGGLLDADFTGGTGNLRLSAA